MVVFVTLSTKVDEVAKDARKLMSSYGGSGIGVPLMKAQMP
jgi:hypothetical protein